MRPTLEDVYLQLTGDHHGDPAPSPPQADTP
jgi:hypothetical protein